MQFLKEFLLTVAFFPISLLPFFFNLWISSKMSLRLSLPVSATSLVFFSPFWVTLNSPLYAYLPFSVLSSQICDEATEFVNCYRSISFLNSVSANIIMFRKTFRTNVLFKRRVTTSSSRSNLSHDYDSKLLKKYDAVVIGGGHNGLVAAYYLAKSGKKVCVLEKRHTLGGAAVTEEIVPGFKFSRASYVLGLLRPHIYADMQLQRHGLKVHTRNPSSYTPIHESYRGHFPSSSLLLGPDESQNFEEISKFSVKDAQAFPHYEALLNKFIDCLSPLLDSPPPDLKVLDGLNFFQKMRYLASFSHLYKA
ncbi:UNVERIFIED_CONTAM: hypothetical protein GTU68_012206, partial [Idotea baltica]|nr:hypothetical protein [Idotea baltica]